MQRSEKSALSYVAFEPTGAQVARPGGMGGPKGGGRAKKREFSLNENIQHAHRTTKGGLADSIASRIPPGQAGIFHYIQDHSCVQVPQGGANLAPKKAKMGPTTRPDGVQRRQNRAKMV